MGPDLGTLMVAGMDDSQSEELCWTGQQRNGVAAGRACGNEAWLILNVGEILQYPCML